ncbi:SDR family NAD(P)-dependent oxidoreductase, partial [Senegalimassilia anaerobia]
MVLPENIEGSQNGADVGGAVQAGGAARVANMPQSGRDAAVSQEASADSTAGPPALCALVTGATGGIGRELCAQLARECGTLALVGRDRGKLEELAKDLVERFDVDTRVFVADFAQPGAVDAL